MFLTNSSKILMNGTNERFFPFIPFPVPRRRIIERERERERIYFSDILYDNSLLTIRIKRTINHCCQDFMTASFRSLCIVGIAEFANRSVFAWVTTYFSFFLVLTVLGLRGNISCVNLFFVHLMANLFMRVILLVFNVCRLVTERAWLYET